MTAKELAETLDRRETGEPWCIGIVFSMVDLEVTA